MYTAVFKRFFDLTLAVIGFVVLLPVFGAVTVILFFTNKGHPFYLQERPGLNEEPFWLIKFKTMSDETDSSGQLLPNHLRITKIGRILRSTSLDELPQLMNVIKGEMSVIGPRPLLFKYIPLYSKEQRRRHNVRPGLSGWAQVNGRNSISWKRKFEFDVYYVDNLCFWLDIKILLKTLVRVFSTSGVNAGEKVTMPPFDGTN